MDNYGYIFRISIWIYHLDTKGYCIWICMNMNGYTWIYFPDIRMDMTVGYMIRIIKDNQGYI